MGDPDLSVHVRQADPSEADEFFTAAARQRAEEALEELEQEQQERIRRAHEEHDVTIPGLRVLHS